MKKFIVSAFCLFAAARSKPALAVDNLGDKFSAALQLIGNRPMASIAGPIGTMHNLNVSQLRSRIASDELFNTSQLLIAGTQNPSMESQNAVCRSTAVGLNLIVGSEVLPDYNDLLREFADFREVFWNIRSILECDGSARDNPYGIHVQNIASEQFCLNMNNRNDGAPNNVYPCNVHPDQIWSFQHVDGEWFTIRNDQSEKCINLQAGNDGKETNIWSCGTHTDQQWRIIWGQDGNIQLQNRSFGKCLALGHPGVSAQTQARSCDGGDRQQLWKLVK
ncbi:MAG: RICIN domain-containing protein [Oligoflexus sp.]|nr:RICIN domain-containing protein [Oligoflexus sp.]